MHIKPGFMLREIAGQWLVVPIGERTVSFNKLLSLSESGALLWRTLERDIELEELVTAMRAEYEVDDETARADILEFVTLLETQELLA